MTLHLVHYYPQSLFKAETIFSPCNRTLIVLLEKRNLILKKHLHTYAPTLSVFPFCRLPTTGMHTTNTHAPRKLWWMATPKKQTGLWLGEPDRSWLAPTNPLSEPVLHINNTNTSIRPIPPHPYNLCRQTAQPCPPFLSFPQTRTLILLIFFLKKQTKTKRQSRRY